MTRSGRGDGVGVRRALLGYPTRHKVSDAVAIRRTKEFFGEILVCLCALRDASSECRKEQFHTTRALNYAASWILT